jgi:flagellar basal-body rod protein FlgC
MSEELSEEVRVTIKPARSVALTGLSLQRRRIEATAANVANAATDGYQAIRVEAIAEEGGGVSAHIATTPDPGVIVLDENGEPRTLSNTNLASETVAQIAASNAFAANVAVIETADEMDEALLDEKI